MKAMQTVCALFVLAALGASGGTSADVHVHKRVIERGRYLVRIGGCNDCHTPNYPQAGGQIPEADWLMGNPVGFQGPWGTTYPSNLRLVANSLSEAQWLKTARAEMRPPMPWFGLRQMTDTDLQAVYWYVRSLGAKGEPAPAYAPPGQPPNTPYIVLVPQNLPKQAQAGR